MFFLIARTALLAARSCIRACILCLRSALAWSAGVSGVPPAATEPGVPRTAGVEGPGVASNLTLALEIDFFSMFAATMLDVTSLKRLSLRPLTILSPSLSGSSALPSSPVSGSPLLCAFAPSDSVSSMSKISSISLEKTRLSSSSIVPTPTVCMFM